MNMKLRRLWTTMTRMKMVFWTMTNKCLSGSMPLRVMGFTTPNKASDKDSGLVKIVSEADCDN